MPEVKDIENISDTKRIIMSISIALIVIAILIFIYNPDIIKKIWLWIIGLLGPIIAVLKNASQKIESFFIISDKSIDQSAKPHTAIKTNKVSSEEEIINNSVNEIQLENSYKKIAELQDEIKKLQLQLNKENQYDNFKGITLSVLRYIDDGETTLGLLFYDDEFFCYTLEDTYREVKIMEETRIPEGTYEVGFNKADTKLTLKYRKSRPWFKYHLHVKNVPNYTGVYIHVGNTNTHTAGCLLVADSITDNNTETTIYNSKEAFKRLYLKLKPLIDDNIPVRIRYFNEDWFKQFKLNRIIA